MSWIALSDLANPTFNIRGIGAPRNGPCGRVPMASHDLVPRGTFVVEFDVDAQPDKPQTVLQFRRAFEWLRELRLTLDAAGHIALDIRQGGTRSRATICIAPPARGSCLRLSYSWNAPIRVGRLTVEEVRDGRIFQSDIRKPVPIPAADIKAITRNGRATQISKSVRCIAFSNEIEPVGFGNGIVSGTLVETAQGSVPVEKLRLGDMVVTATSGLQPVRWIGRRTVPALGSLRPVRLHAPYFGLIEDVLLAPAHRLRLGVVGTDDMAGEDDVPLPAGRLVDGRRARAESRSRLATYHQVLLDVHDYLLLDGLWAESLFVGTIARHPELLRSTVLAEMPVSAVPVHRPFSRPCLTKAETKTLVAALAAG